MNLEDTTGQIIVCATGIHRVLGPGFYEHIYHRCLLSQLQKTVELVEENYVIPMWYEGKKIGARKVDFLIDHKISVEIKVTGRLEDVDIAKAANYIDASAVETGLLINFGSPLLQFRKLEHRKAIFSFIPRSE